eukprot:COSAG05_NODE_31_length_28416_cov_170.150652_12_plen_120_part_00
MGSDDVFGWRAGAGGGTSWHWLSCRRVTVTASSRGCPFVPVLVLYDTLASTTVPLITRFNSCALPRAAPPSGAEPALLWYAISAESRILAPLDHRCCNVRPLSTVYGHPYCPHGSRGPI